MANKKNIGKIWYFSISIIHACPAMWNEMKNAEQTMEENTKNAWSFMIYSALCAFSDWHKKKTILSSTLPSWLRLQAAEAAKVVNIETVFDEHFLKMVMKTSNKFSKTFQTKMRRAKTVQTKYVAVGWAFYALIFYQFICSPNTALAV